MGVNTTTEILLDLNATVGLQLKAPQLEDAWRMERGMEQRQRAKVHGVDEWST